MKILEKEEYQQCGYLWGPTARLKSRAWLQFADDSAVIANTTESAQKLIDLNQAWCRWTGMMIRTDKCHTFGMRKKDGKSEQFLPRLTIDNEIIPQVALNGDFKYLGKIYDFECKNTKTKEHLLKKLTNLLQSIDKLDTTAQWKLQILRRFVPSQLTFDLRIYDISLTWIESSLDSLIIEAVRNWLGLPISSCVAETLSLPFKSGGLNIKLLKSYSISLRLKLRNYLKLSNDDDVKFLWLETKNSYQKIDNMLPESDVIKSTLKSFNKSQQESNFAHLISLQCQGIVMKAVNEHIPATQILNWSRITEKLPEVLYKFVRKYIIQQLPTNTNLVRWGKTSNALCPLCNARQTNKHVLSNCSSISALKRYTDRHNKVLSIIVENIKAVLGADEKLFADLTKESVQPMSILFNSLRPDIAILHKNKIEVLELTVCHESNLTNSKMFKLNKYCERLKNDVKNNYKHLKIELNTFEISPVGFNKIIPLPILKNLWSEYEMKKLINSVIGSSYVIYCERNNAD